MIAAVKIDAYRYDVHDIWIPVSPAAMKLAALGHLAAKRLAIGGVMMSGDILLIDPDKSPRNPNFLFLGAGAPIPGSGVIVGPVCRSIVAPVTFSANDVLERTMFMDWLDAREWIETWRQELDAGVFRNVA